MSYNREQEYAITETPAAVRRRRRAAVAAYDYSETMRLSKLKPPATLLPDEKLSYDPKLFGKGRR